MQSTGRLLYDRNHTGVAERSICGRKKRCALDHDDSTHTPRIESRDRWDSAGMKDGEGCTYRVLTWQSSTGVVEFSKTRQDSGNKFVSMQRHQVRQSSAYHIWLTKAEDINVLGTMAQFKTSPRQWGRHNKTTSLWISNKFP